MEIYLSNVKLKAGQAQHGMVLVLTMPIDILIKQLYGTWQSQICLVHHSGREPTVYSPLTGYVDFGFGIGLDKKSICNTISCVYLFMIYSSMICFKFCPKGEP